MTAIRDAVVQLNDGRAMPAIGLGTFQMPPGDTEALVRTAIDCGYRAIDTAHFYGNEAEVGQAVRDVDEPVFVTSKLWRSDMGREAARAGFAKTAASLPDLDLMLIHWPEPQTGLYIDTWRTLVDLRDEGRVRSIGVSNFTIPHLDAIIADTGVVPAVNQVECHPRFQQLAMQAYCDDRGIALTAWSPLGRALTLDDAALAAIAERHGRCVAQVILRWHHQRGSIIIPKASSRARLQENLTLDDFALDADDMAAIAALDRVDGRIGPDPDDTPGFAGMPPPRTS